MGFLVYIVWQRWEVSHFSRGCRTSPKTEMAFPREPHILFFVPAFMEKFLVVQGIRARRPALLGISSFPHGTLGISTLPPAGRKKDAFECFNRGRKPNFRCRRDKKYIS
ncbi:Uncharacterized protein FWK35_00011733 [Aphis craccivora]|uniref:Uncharacterized protein n=1 Tax=Aphis craccivora TaxID=307492 RepID=A0A6G0Z975_APHCR|nr:Uncharacterized protein FWK35_00011733 [Aphis craccivora]